MEELDKVLIALAKKQSKNLSDKNKIKLTEDIKIVKVAFDIYKIDNSKQLKDHYDGLWKLESDNGQNYLVRASDPQFGYDHSGDWAAISSYDNNNIVLAYKNVPVANFKSSEYNYEPEGVGIFKEALLDRVGSDEEFMSDLLRIQASSKSDALISTFPELKKYLKG